MEPNIDVVGGGIETNDRPPPHLTQKLKAFVKLIRQWALKLRLSVLAIVANCIALGLVDPCDVRCQRPLCTTLQIVEHVIFAIFTFEMLIKMIALGIYKSENAYFTDAWNCFDFVIILISAAEYAFASQDINLSAVRSFRVLRPLRAINRISSLRLLVTLLIDTLPMLGNVLIFCFFIFFVFGIVAVQLWAGILRNRCFFPVVAANNQTNHSTALPNSKLPPPFMPVYYVQPDGEFICSTGFGELSCSQIPEFEKRSSMCAKVFGENLELQEICKSWIANYTDCRPFGPNPYRGTINFDNIGFAWIAIFQVISLQGWTDVLYLVQDSYSFWSWIYFVALIMIGSYVAVNLCLVVIATQFSRTNRRDSEFTVSTDDTQSASTHAEGLYAQVIALLRHLIKLCWSKVHKVKPQVDDQLLGLSIIQQERIECPLCHHSSVCGPQMSIRQQPCSMCGRQLREHKSASWRQIQRQTSNIRDKCGLQISRSQQWCRRILEHNATVAVTLCAIVFNAVIMGLEHHGQSPELTTFIEAANLAFTALFLLELSLKFFAYGPLTFITETFFNLLDTIVILVNIAEIFLTGSASGFSVLRLFRLFRLVKIIRYLPQLQKQLLVMLKTIDNVMSFFFLLSFFVYITALLGMSLFGCKFRSVKSDEFPLIMNLSGISSKSFLSKPSDANFDTLLQSIFTVLQILTQDSWGSVMRDGMYYTSDWAGLYFVCLVAIGNYMLFNLLIAILVEGYSSITKDEPARVVASTAGHRESLSSNETQPLGQNAADSKCWLMRWLSNCWTYSKRSKRSLYLFEKHAFPRRQLKVLVSSPYFDNFFMVIILSSCVPIILERPSIDRDGLERRVLQISSYVFSVLFALEAAVKMVAYGFIFGPKSYLKRSYWNVTDFFLMCLSLIDIILEFMPNSDSTIQQFLRVLYLLRCLRPLRVISRAHGLQIVLKTLICSMKPIGNVILICCFLFWIFAILGVQLFRGCFASCKPPRFINNGTTIMPTNATYRKWAETVIERNVTTLNDCLELGFEWSNERYNFDSLPNALMALFVFSTLDGWGAISRNGVHCVGDGMQPIRGYNSYALGYFLAFLLIVCFFTLNMFVGVVVNNFREVQMRMAIQLERKRRAMRVVSLLEYSDNKTLLRIKRKARTWSCRSTNSRSLYQNSIGLFKRGDEVDTFDDEIVADMFWQLYPPWRRFIFKFVTHKYFELAVIATTCFNVLIIASEFYLMPPSFTLFIRMIGYFFLTLIMLEAILKVVAWGFRRYITNRWNQIDLLIVVLSILGRLIEDNVEGAPINPMIVRATRIFRIARLFKLLKSAGSLRRLLKAVKQAIPQAAHLTMLFVLIFFIYASLGVQLYGTFDCSDGESCYGLSRHANFHNVGMAMLTLFRIFTGDNWNGVLKDVLAISNDLLRCNSTKSLDIAAGNIDPARAISCGVIQILAPVYFVSFVLLTHFVLINIFVAVLMGELEDVHRRRVTNDTNFTRTGSRRSHYPPPFSKEHSPSIESQNSVPEARVWKSKSLPCLKFRDNYAAADDDDDGEEDDNDTSPSEDITIKLVMTKFPSAPALNVDSGDDEEQYEDRSEINCECECDCEVETLTQQQLAKTVESIDDEIPYMDTGVPEI